MKPMRLKLLTFGLSLILSFLMSVDCSAPKEVIPSLAATDQPLYSCGGDNSGRYYKMIEGFVIGKNGRAYLWDQVNFDGIDVYDDAGKFLLNFGRPGQGPDELQNFSAATLDSNGNFLASTFGRKALKIFTPEGKLKGEILLPDEISRGYVSKMILAPEDSLYLRIDSEAGDVSIYNFNLREHRVKLIHEEKRRKEPSFIRFAPDMAVDDHCNIYVADVFDYKIFVYSPDGKLIRIYENKTAKKEPIIDSDFNTIGDDFKTVIRLDFYQMLMAELEGPSRYFPVVFGLNIDRDRLYVWTSERDNLNRYVIDIFDLNFRKRGRASYFNWIKRNLAQIVGGRLYIPNIENYDINLTRQLGRLSLFNPPEKLNVYPVR